MNMNRIEKFIEDNKLDFTESDSGLNSNCVIIAGYALHIGLSEDELVEYINEIEDIDLEIKVYPYDAVNNCITLEDELRRVYRYAYTKYYGDWWDKDEAHEMYKF